MEFSLSDSDTPQITHSEGHPLYNSICDKINAYILKNNESIDLSEIKDIVNRILTKEYEAATSKMSIPMYLGLVGTYSGVGLGLAMLIIAMAGNSDRMFDTEAVYQFIGGIIVAMGTSLIGLLMTIWCNRNASKLDEELESGKDRFFCFLQTKVIPDLPSTLTQTIQEELRKPIHDLGQVVRLLNERLGKTFESATKEFGQNLTKNLRELDHTIYLISNIVKIQADNLNKQDALINRLSSSGFSHLLERITRAAEKNEEVVGNIRQSGETLLLLQEKARETQSALICAQEQSLRIIQGMDQATIETAERFCELIREPEKLYLHIDRTLQEFAQFREFIVHFTTLEEQDKMQYIERIDAQLQGIKRAGDTIDHYLTLTHKELGDTLNKQQEVLLLQMDRFSNFWHNLFLNLESKSEENPLNHLKNLSSLNNKIDNILTALSSIVQQLSTEKNFFSERERVTKNGLFSRLFRRSR